MRIAKGERERKQNKGGDNDDVVDEKENGR